VREQREPCRSAAASNCPTSSPRNDYLDISVRFRRFFARDFPVVLLGEREWEGLLEWLRTSALADRRIDPGDLAHLHIIQRPAHVAELGRRRAQPPWSRMSACGDLLNHPRNQGGCDPRSSAVRSGHPTRARTAVSVTDTAAAALDAVRVEQAMSHRVVSCRPEAPLGAVAQTMADQRIHCVVVAGIVDTAAGEQLSWGVLTDRDVIEAATGGAPGRTAGELARPYVAIVDRTDSLRLAAELMYRLGTSHLVVADRRTGNAVGVISSLDVAGLIARP
jgi:CBS domain-containing protein